MSFFACAECHGDVPEENSELICSDCGSHLCSTECEETHSGRQCTCDGCGMGLEPEDQNCPDCEKPV